MKTSKLTFSESIIGWLIDFFMKKVKPANPDKSDKFRPEVVARNHW
jgi:hypothetical protein